MARPNTTPPHPYLTASPASRPRRPSEDAVASVPSTAAERTIVVDAKPNLGPTAAYVQALVDRMQRPEVKAAAAAAFKASAKLGGVAMNARRRSR